MTCLKLNANIANFNNDIESYKIKKTNAHLIWTFVSNLYKAFIFVNKVQQIHM